jgi:UDP-N-acetylglucosamine acyltransferase
MSLIDRKHIRSSAELADGVEVGPWSIVGAGVEIGEGTHRAARGAQGADPHRQAQPHLPVSSVGEDTPI